MPGAYPFFELEIRKRPDSLAIRAKGALTIDSVRTIDEAIAIMGAHACYQKLCIDLEEVFRFEYCAAAKLARTIRQQARRCQSLKISGAEQDLIGVFKTSGVPQRCWQPEVRAFAMKWSDKKQARPQRDWNHKV